jgi:uncharacterized protein
VSDADDVAAWLADRSERVIETSCARIYLAGDRALKVKRPVSLGFLDFSTLDKRRWALDRELAFNRRGAPDIYRVVLPITREPAGGCALAGAGPILEWALEMRRFDEDGVLSNHPEDVTGEVAEALGRVIARAHMAAPVTPDGGGVGALAHTLATNAEHLRTQSAILGAEAIERVIAGTQAALASHSPLLEARRIAGFARHCHGDLHLGNILLENGAPILFDCIEFNDALSQIDVLYDLAFLIMDLGFRGHREAANRVLNAWLDEVARGLPPSLWEGLAALALMLSARAAVRAHVTAATGDASTARSYLAAAEGHLSASPPRLFAVGGLSGTGKTTFARALAPRLPGAPGAVILRSDEIRKRKWLADPLERLPPEAYVAPVHERVYAELFDVAGRLLAAGRSVILDAAFLAPAERGGAAAVARASGAAFQGVWLEGDQALLRARLDARRGDASDADADVLGGQLARDLGPIEWRKIAAGADFVAAAETLAAGRPS